MQKTHQAKNSKWLKKQSIFAANALRIILFFSIISGLLIVAQIFLLATLLQALIIEHTPREVLLTHLFSLFAIFTLRAAVYYLRERASFYFGTQIRQVIRRKLIDHLSHKGPAWVKHRPTGSWATIILEQIEELQEYYAKYLPQLYLAISIPFLLLIATFTVNWIAGLILLVTAPLIPLFMILVGSSTAATSRRYFTILSRLSGDFLDKIKGIQTLRFFNRGQIETEALAKNSESLRHYTLLILWRAFLSSAVLEFFTALAIALVAVYFGFSYLGCLGESSATLTLFSGFFSLLLAPEFFQPLRELGAFYHAKNQAMGAAEALISAHAETERESKVSQHSSIQKSSKKSKPIFVKQGIRLQAEDLSIFSHDGKVLAGPFNFTIEENQRIAIVGRSGAGKTSLLNALLGFLPFEGELLLDEHPFTTLDLTHWRKHINWLGQNPHLPGDTLLENITFQQPYCENALNQAIQRAHLDAFIAILPDGLHTKIGEYAARLSVGQAQRIALARILLHKANLLLLDEPTASLDAHSEAMINRTLLQYAQKQTTLLVTHQLSLARQFDLIWVMDAGKIVEIGHYEALCRTSRLFNHLLACRQEELKK